MLVVERVQIREIFIGSCTNTKHVSSELAIHPQTNFVRRVSILFFVGDPRFDLDGKFNNGIVEFRFGVFHLEQRFQNG